MSSRLNILVLIIILILLVGMVLFLGAVSPAFQSWASVWLERPDGLAATAAMLGAIATFGAVVVGLQGIRAGQVIAWKAMEEGQREFLEAQYNASRPLLVPVSQSPGEWYDYNQVATLDWSAENMMYTLQNVGTGIATNIWGVFMPPASMMEGTQQYAYRFGAPLVPGTDPLEVWFMAGMTSFETNDKIGDYFISAPKEPASTSQADSADLSIGRLTLTYTDIFGRKHASIFDLGQKRGWNNVAFLVDIQADLGELFATKGKKATVAAS